MRLAIIAFLLGVCALQMQARLPNWHESLMLCSISLLLLALCWRKPGLLRCWPVLGLSVGFMWAAVCAHWQLQTSLPKALEGEDISVIGSIANLPHTNEQGVRFLFDVEDIVQANGEAFAHDSADARKWQALRGMKIALGWYMHHPIHQPYLQQHPQQASPQFFPPDQAMPSLQPGERWRLQVRLQRPHGNANPHGFDYELWLLEQGVRATGYVRPEKEGHAPALRLNEFVPKLGYAIERMRDSLRQQIFAALPNKAYAGVVVALVIGDQRVVGLGDWQLFNNTGISHLMSISGLHITMVAAMFGKLMELLWRRSFFTRAQLPLRMPAQKVAALTAFLMALVYVLLAGSAVPAQRTLYMLAVVAAASWYGRNAQVSDIMCWALGTVLILDPWAVLSPGFWLSFTAVALIVYSASGRAERLSLENYGQQGRLTQLWQALQAGARTQAVITLGLLPMSMLLFSQISLVSPFANALAIPLVSFFITPLALIGAVLGALFPPPFVAWLLQMAHVLIEALVWFLQALQEVPQVTWIAPQPSAWQVLVASVGMLWLFAPRGWPLRIAGSLCLLPIILQKPSAPPEGSLWLTAFDVGQGTAVLLETAQHRLLYDAGPSYSPLSDGAQRVILPYLKARGISHLDQLILTHSDLDHTGGAPSILENLSVTQLRAALLDEHPLWLLARNKQIAPVRCLAGQKWQWDGVQLEVLHPNNDSYRELDLKPNARSCTLRVQVGQQRILLTGDIEAREEKQLIAQHSQALRAEVLLVPHHGSGTSSTLPFLMAVQPKLAIFQFGYRNRYRHPKDAVWQRYAALDIERLRNDESGAIILKIDGSIKDAPIQVENYRKLHARYWYGR